MKWPTVKTYLRKTSQFSLVSKFIQQTFTIFNCIDSTMPDALEEENTYIRKPILKGEREENP